MLSHRLPVFALGLIALYLSPISAQAALIERTPTVHVAVPGVESQAQLADTLRAQGYTGIVLSSVVATTDHPYPQNNVAFTNEPAITPVHGGWNGVALKDGQTVQVYVDR